MLPKVLITGFPDSGTSFLCNLVADLGFSPGSVYELKQADSHNPWGYWEYRPIYRYIRSVLDGPTRMIAEDIPETTMRFPKEPDLLLFSLAMSHRVEVYKDPGLPLFYHLFDPEAKIIVIHRDLDEMFESNGLKHLGYDFTKNSLLEATDKYLDLVLEMRKERDVCEIWYHDFRGNGFDIATGIICEFLDVPYKEGLNHLFRPRKA